MLPVLGFLPLPWETQIEFLAPGYSCYMHLGSEAMDKRFWSLWLCQIKYISKSYKKCKTFLSLGNLWSEMLCPIWEGTHLSFDLCQEQQFFNVAVYLCVCAYAPVCTCTHSMGIEASYLFWSLETAGVLKSDHGVLKSSSALGKFLWFMRFTGGFLFVKWEIESISRDDHLSLLRQNKLVG